MKISFVTNLCAHYNVGTFELLARDYDIDFYFFSAGDEWYWPKEHGYRSGMFHSEYLPGFQLGRTRVTLSLPWKLLLGGYDLYIKCINGRFALPVTYLIARLRRKPFILWTGVWMRLQTKFQRLVYPLTRYIYRHADAVVVYGEHVKTYLIREGVAPERIFVAPHATDNAFYSQDISQEQKDALLARLGISPHQRVILYLGRLEESKGVSYLLQAFAKVARPDVILVIAGTGTLQKHLENLAKELGLLQNIRFAGYVPIEAAPQFYSIAWMFVLPSITVATGKEPWGLVVNEAFNQGVPVIATDTVGAAAGGLIQDGYNGFIVREQNSAELSESMERLISNPELRQSMSIHARKSIQEWDYPRNVQGYHDAIQYVLARRK
jgi:glycosyltransferase involved in cell wall biosynthesis